MKPVSFLGVVVGVACAAVGGAQSRTTAAVTVLVPVTDDKGSVADSTASDGSRYPVFKLAEHSPLVRQVYGILATSFAHEVIRLERYARNLLLTDAVGAPRPELKAPAYVLMSKEEGGFARQGFWLDDVKEGRRLVRAGYVDLVITTESMESGDLEEIFSHELGHQILHDLVGALPPRQSRNMHQSMTVTDYPTAFDEGYAEHFQPLARDATSNPALRALSAGATATDLAMLWISRLDTQLRTDGVKRNLFIHRKALPAAALDGSADRYVLYVADETSTAFVDELRNGQEMMASEGVIATLFYRIVSNPTIRAHRREPAFYRAFLAAGQSPEAISPYENANLKLFVAMRHAAKTIASGAPPMFALVQSYAETFPDEARAIYTVFLETTRGATASQEVARAFERAATEGRRGDITAFRSSSRAAFTLLDSTIDRVTHGGVAVDANVGPELWLLNTDFKIASALWDPNRTLEFTLNLNTASEVDLMTIPGVDLGTARKTIAIRRAGGFFRSFDDLASVVSPELHQTFVLMHNQMGSSGPERPPRSDRR